MLFRRPLQISHKTPTGTSRTEAHSIVRTVPETMMAVWSRDRVCTRSNSTFESHTARDRARAPWTPRDPVTVNWTWKITELIKELFNCQIQPKNSGIGLAFSRYPNPYTCFYFIKMIKYILIYQKTDLSEQKDYIQHVMNYSNMTLWYKDMEQIQLLVILVLATLGQRAKMTSK